jgi:hypothetical protein
MTFATTALVAVTSLLVFVSCVVLVFHKDYDSGVIGGTGLAMVAFAAFARFMHVVDGVSTASPLSAMLWSGLALFMGRLVVRFLMRCERRDHTWYEGPDCAKRARPQGAVGQP